MLGYAGILDGRHATTHWEAAERFASTFPAVRVDAGALYVDDDGVFTSAGSAASIDLAVHLVRADFGAEVANAVARDLVVAPHREGGQAQYIDVPVRQCSGDDLLTEALQRARSNLGEALSVERLADRAAMSPRTFARRFRSTMGTTPHQWLTAQRVVLAQELLERTDLSVDHVAQRTGFGTAAAFRSQFRRHTRTTPLAYRRTFQGRVDR